MNWSELFAREKELELSLQDHLIWKNELHVAWLRDALNKVQQELFDYKKSV